jgi:hypothetical protein
VINAFIVGSSQRNHPSSCFFALLSSAARSPELQDLLAMHSTSGRFLALPGTAANETM